MPPSLPDDTPNIQNNPHYDIVKEYMVKLQNTLHELGYVSAGFIFFGKPDDLEENWLLLTCIDTELERNTLYKLPHVLSREIQYFVDTNQ